MTVAQSASHPYLIPDRFEDVIFLIQFLGLRKYFSLTAANESVRQPRSANTWAEICDDHPEFFDVTKEKSVFLSLRFHLNESGAYVPIGLDAVQKLISNALEIHERQFKADCEEKARAVQASKSLREWGTLLAALIAAAASVLKLLIG